MLQRNKNAFFGLNSILPVIKIKSHISFVLIFACYFFADYFHFNHLNFFKYISLCGLELDFALLANLKIFFLVTCYKLTLLMWLIDLVLVLQYWFISLFFILYWSIVATFNVFYFASLFMFFISIDI